MTTKESIQFYGGIRALADAIGVWPHVIYRWGDHPPMARQYELFVKSNGVLKIENE